MKVKVYEGTGTKSFAAKQGDKIKVVFQGVSHVGTQHHYILEMGWWSTRENAQGEFEEITENEDGTLDGEPQCIRK